MKGFHYEVVVVQLDVEVAQAIEEAINHYGFLIDLGEYESKTPVHHVHHGCEIVIPHEGVADVFYGDWQRRIWPGQACVGPGNTPHGAAGLFDRTVIHFSLDLLSSKHDDFKSMIEQCPEPSALTLDHHAIRRLVWVSKELIILRQHQDLPVIRDLMDLTVTEIKKALTNPTTHNHHQVWMNNIISYMQSTLRNDETLDAVAQRFGMSRSHMTAMFIKHLNCSPGEFWLRLRLEHACRLLGSNMAIQDVADQVGFQTTSGFQRAFRRHFGMTASAYRNLLEQSNVDIPQDCAFR